MIPEISRDKFLDGRLLIDQPKQGYRAGIDPVLLAAAVPAVSGQTVLELGCGVGTASLCLSARVRDLTLTGVEIQPDYAELARANARRAKVLLQVLETDIRALPMAVRQKNFDHVFANPPYYLREQGTTAQDEGREQALGEGAPLSDWVDVAVKRLAPGGCLTMIQNADRLPEMLAAAFGRLGAVEVLPLVSRSGRSAGRIILRGRKGRRTPFRLLSPLVLHQGATHFSDADSYRPEIDAVLRGGACLPGFES
ncbi:tRNA1(Val) (adenine(37)-N6)-methyltransferase [Qingshengfaniella alkalisoli]|uniref:Methyltransferase n=1 Tax=Qingshengfaniella alkalisoli TaxID=2599296 RepID=A0A5B8I7S8_9RHOB|nr:methyltransferase [Qingshengfaniella alkalisoli]QDY68586.1 methyltransferase [Qingshengfaniella alkalisoli]